ncbi:unnamed protein product [Candida verbasci]|uniref:Vacuolar import and degradation protein 27 n=1 Tax=Candida verbasci TaxID=1227364 RepID=A0A9W4XJ27_9ASCO|nr:unnamed protein product [Candida verbasci]
MNFLRKFLGTTTTDEIASIPSGKLFLTRSKESPKGAIECLYNDALGSIKQTTRPFYYQLCITRIYQEGEAELYDQEDSDYEEDEEDETSISSNDHQKRKSKEEWVFSLTEDLKIHKFTKSDGSVVIAWNDLQGDLGDKFEFIIDEDVRKNDIEQFIMTIYKCLYENKYRQSSISASDEELKEFEYDPKSELFTFDDFEEEEEEESEEEEENNEPKGEVIYEIKDVALLLYDAISGTFLPVCTENVKIFKLDKFEYSLFIKKTNINCPLSKNMSPTFNYEHNSFIFNIFNYQSDPVTANSYLIKFDSFNDLTKFQNKFLSSMYETLNQKEWDQVEEDYFVDAFSDLNVKDKEKDEESEEEEEDEVDSEVPDSLYEFDSKDKNKNLAVGYKDRSYVSRGNKLGVFGEEENSLKFKTTISNISDLKGKTFIPSKLLLHQEDRYMILSNPEEENKLFKMDLNRGSVVEEWDTNLPVVNYGPNSKFAQLTDEATLTGVSNNAVFNLDPRLKGNKIVNEKIYKTKNNQFQTLTTTEQGFIALGTGKGDIRLYDKLGSKAKTALPSLGDAIIGLDVSRDGKYLLATCKDYLLLIDTTINNGKNQGKIGFTNYFDKDKKPIPKRLSLKPEHEAYIVRENNKPIEFTPGYFNTGLNAKEETIVTSIGKYIISWSLKKILNGNKDSYIVKRYQQDIIADNFKFNSKNIIMASKDDVSMVNRRSLTNPKKIFN